MAKSSRGGNGAQTSAKQRLGGGSGSSNGKKMPIIIEVEDINTDAWKLESVCNMIEAGKVGVIPTDTCYSFVASTASRDAVAQLLRCKDSGKKPLSFLCKDIAMVDKYTSELSREKWVYKLLRSTLPGPFTFVLPCSEQVPKFVLDRKHHRLTKWKRKEIGIRIPDDAVCAHLLKGTSVPLLAGSIPESGEDYVDVLLGARKALLEAEGEGGEEHGAEDGEWLGDGDWAGSDGSDGDDEDYSAFSIADFSQEAFESFPWVHLVDFIVINGHRGGGTREELSTIVDLTSGQPVVLRQGKGVIA